MLDVLRVLRGGDGDDGKGHHLGRIDSLGARKVLAAVMVRFSTCRFASWSGVENKRDGCGDVRDVYRGVRDGVGYDVSGRLGGVTSGACFNNCVGDNLSCVLGRWYRVWVSSWWCTCRVAWMDRGRRAVMLAIHGGGTWLVPCGCRRSARSAGGRAGVMFIHRNRRTVVLAVDWSRTWLISHWSGRAMVLSIHWGRAGKITDRCRTGGITNWSRAGLVANWGSRRLARSGRASTINRRRSAVITTIDRCRAGSISNRR